MAEKAYPNAPPYPMDGQPAQYSAGFVPEQPPPPYNATGGHIGFQPPPSQHQHAPTVQPIMQNRVVTHVYSVAPAVGPDPSSLQCPSCRQHITTRLDYQSSTKTHIMAGLLCCFICWPCAWVPYVMDSCKNANHFCPNCSAFIGTYKS